MMHPFDVVAPVSGHRQRGQPTLDLILHLRAANGALVATRPTALGRAGHVPVAAIMLDVHPRAAPIASDFLGILPISTCALRFAIR
jgi:hypothetical protein